MKCAIIIGSLVRQLVHLDAEGVLHIQGLTARALAGSQTTALGQASSAIYLQEDTHESLYWLFRHGVGDDSILPHLIDYRANLLALKHQGVEAVIAINSVGSTNKKMPPGCHVVPDQIIDYTWGRAQTYHGCSAALDLPSHVDFTQPFAEVLRLRWLAKLAQAKVEAIDGGVCAVTQGPQLETKAQVEKLRRDGCDLINMTLAPEAILARELNLQYICSAVVINWGAGLFDTDKIDFSQCQKYAQQGVESLLPILSSLHLD